MMVSRKVVASLLLVYLVSLLAEQTEGFMPFFTQSDFQKMQSLLHGRISVLRATLATADGPSQQAEAMRRIPHWLQAMLQEKERNKGGQKKSLSSLQQLDEEGFSEQSSVGVNTAKTIQQAVPVRPGMWLTPRQLEKYQDVLEKLLAELLQDTPDAD